MHKSIDNILFLFYSPRIKINNFSGYFIFDNDLFKKIYLSDTEQYGFYNPVIQDTIKRLSIDVLQAREFLLSILDKRLNLNKGYLFYDDFCIYRNEPRIVRFPEFNFNINEKVKDLYESIEEIDSSEAKNWYGITFEFIKDPDNIRKISDILKNYRENYCIKDIYLEIERVG